MAVLDQWGIDIFGLDSIANGHSVMAITYTVLKVMLHSSLPVHEGNRRNYLRKRALCIWYEVYLWRFGLVVMPLGTSTKLLYVEQG